MERAAPVSDDVLRSMEESVAVVRLDDFRIAFWSPAAERIFGWKAEEVLGEALHEVAASDGWTRATLEGLVERVRADGRVVVSGPRHRKDGGRLWIESTFSIARDAAESEIGLLAVTRDITARREAEEQLVESEQASARREALLRATFTTLSEGVVVFSAEGTVTSANPAAERILGLSPEPSSGRAALTEDMQAVREDGSPFPADLQPAAVARRTGAPCSAELMGIAREGEPTRWISSAAAPLGLTEGKPPYAVVATFRDVTELRHEQTRLAEHTARLEEALTQVRTLHGLLPICMFCHKIRNDGGYWDRIESYIAERTHAAFTHSLCPSCEAVHFPDADGGKT